MKRALSFLFLLLTVAVTQPAVAADRPSCAYVRSIDNWRVKSPRAVFIDVRIRDAQGAFIATFSSECFARWPKNTIRVEAQGACLAPGDSMFFTFPPPSKSSNAPDSEERCVVSRVERWSPPVEDSQASKPWYDNCREENGIPRCE